MKRLFNISMQEVTKRAVKGLALALAMTAMAPVAAQAFDLFGPKNKYEKSTHQTFPRLGPDSQIGGTHGYLFTLPGKPGKRAIVAVNEAQRRLISAIIDGSQLEVRTRTNDGLPMKAVFDLRQGPLTFRNGKVFTRSGAIDLKAYNQPETKKALDDADLTRGLMILADNATTAPADGVVGFDLGDGQVVYKLDSADATINAVVDGSRGKVEAQILDNGRPTSLVLKYDYAAGGTTSFPAIVEQVERSLSPEAKVELGKMPIKLARGFIASVTARVLAADIAARRAVKGVVETNPYFLGDTYTTHFQPDQFGSIQQTLREAATHGCHFAVPFRVKGATPPAPAAEEKPAPKQPHPSRVHPAEKSAKKPAVAKPAPQTPQTPKKPQTPKAAPAPIPGEIKPVAPRENGANIVKNVPHSQQAMALRLV